MLGDIVTLVTTNVLVSFAALYLLNFQYGNS